MLGPHVATFFQSCNMFLCLSHKNPRAACGSAGPQQPVAPLEVPRSACSHFGRGFQPLSKNSLNKLSMLHCFLTRSLVRDIFSVIAVNKKVCLINIDCYFSHMFNTSCRALKIDRQSVTHDVQIEKCDRLAAPTHSPAPQQKTALTHHGTRRKPGRLKVIQ